MSITKGPVMCECGQGFHFPENLAAHKEACQWPKLVAERDALKLQKSEAEALCYRLREILRAVEWQQDQEYSDRFWCSYCERNKRDGHSDACDLGHALQGAFPPYVETIEQLKATIETLKEQADAKNDLRAELNRQDRLNCEYKAALEEIRQLVHPKGDEPRLEGCSGCKAERVLGATEKRKDEPAGCPHTNRGKIDNEPWECRDCGATL